MILVSQDMEMDIPYGLFPVYIQREEEKFFIRVSQNDRVSYNMGKYSTKEKALKVMSLLRGANVLNDSYFVFPADDDERLRR